MKGLSNLEIAGFLRKLCK